MSLNDENRCSTIDRPFFRILLAFRSMLTVNRHCSSSKILMLLRRKYLAKNDLRRIILHEIRRGDEIFLNAKNHPSELFPHGIYLIFLEENVDEFQPLVDLRFFPSTFLPEKLFLPKRRAFFVFDRRDFAQRFVNLLDDELQRKSFDVSLGSEDLAVSNVSRSPFAFRVAHPMNSAQIFLETSSKISKIHFQQFDQNDLVLFKERLTAEFFDSSSLLKLTNFLYDLSLKNELDRSEIIYHHDENWIEHRVHRDTGKNSLSILMKYLFRIDQLEKYSLINREKVRLFNERFSHLAHLGQVKFLTKKLFELDLFDQQTMYETSFHRFVDDHCQRFLPKTIPFSVRGLKEIVHQLRIHRDRLGLVSSLILINFLQFSIRSNSLFLLGKSSNFRIDFEKLIELVQSARFNSVDFQRFIDLNLSPSESSKVKRISLRKKLNDILRNVQSTTDRDRIVQNLRLSAERGELEKNLEFSFDEDGLQSLIIFLAEQSCLDSSIDLCAFLLYLRHFAQLAIIDQSPIADVLNGFHIARDRNSFSTEQFRQALKTFRNVDYLSVNDRLNLRDFDQFLKKMVIEGVLTQTQSCLVVDHLLQIDSITSFDFDEFLNELQLEFACGQLNFTKLINRIETIAESYSTSLAEFHSLERDLIQLFSNGTNASKRLPDEIRRRLNDLMNICRLCHFNQKSVDQLFGSEMNRQFYSKVREIIKTKSVFNQKQSLTAVVQIHKHFIEICATCPKKRFLENNFNERLFNDLQRISRLACLQEKSFVDLFATENAELNKTRRTIEKCLLNFDFNHRDVRSLVEHLTSLENSSRIDVGTSIEIQNCANRLARFGKYSQPKIDELCRRIFLIDGKKASHFQELRWCCFLLKQLTRAIELESQLQRLTTMNRIDQHLHCRFRQFLYEILQNHRPVDELTRCRLPAMPYFPLNEIDLYRVKLFLKALPNDFDAKFPMSLTDEMIERLKWDGKHMDDTTLRDRLYQLERSETLTRDTFDKIFNEIFRNFQLSSSSTDKNHLLDDLFVKLNDLSARDRIDSSDAFRIKTQLMFIEENYKSFGASSVIDFQARLFNASELSQLRKVALELHRFIHDQQYRLAKVNDLIQIWQFNADANNSNERIILKLFRELADLNQLYDPSMPNVFDRFLEIKTVNINISRQLIRTLQRLKARAISNRSITESIRTIESRLSKFDVFRRLTPSFIDQLEKRLKQVLPLSTRSSDSLRTEIFNYLSEQLEDFLRANDDQTSTQSQEFLRKLDSYISQIKRLQSNTSLNRTQQIGSDVTMPKFSPSLHSLESTA